MTDSPLAHADALADVLTIDHRLALKTAASRLRDEFADTFGPETIESYLYSSFNQFASRATILNFLPLLAERFARQRLHALAKVEGKTHTGTPTVLFLCTHNAGRSQMALGWFTHLAEDTAIAWSGGTEPSQEVNPVAVAAMAEVGIDIAREYPKPWTEEILRAADVIVTMGCGDACPIYPGRRYENWDLPDPDNQPLDVVRSIRDDIEARVRILLAELDTPAN
jgi:protein-tyrosine-phosphatase